METCYKVMATDVARSRSTSSRIGSTSSRRFRPSCCAPATHRRTAGALRAAQPRAGQEDRLARRRARHPGAAQYRVSESMRRSSAALWRPRWRWPASDSWGTWAVGGSDSSCYALMAEALRARAAATRPARWPPRRRGPDAHAHARARRVHPVARTAGRGVADLRAGLSVLLAPIVALGGREACFCVTPLAADCWCGSPSCWRGASPAAWPAASARRCSTASSPIVLFQAVQPMNDIVTAALWVGRRRGHGGRPSCAPGRRDRRRGDPRAAQPRAARARRGGCGSFPGRAHERCPVPLLAGAFRASPSLLLAESWCPLWRRRMLQSGYGDAGALFAWRTSGQQPVALRSRVLSDADGVSRCWAWPHRSARRASARLASVAARRWPPS